MAAPWWRWPVEVALTWLMPWRAVRTIREQREDVRLLTLMLAIDVASARDLLGKTRTREWWNSPRPLAIALAALMPWRAVEALRTRQRSFRYVADRLAALHRQDEELEAAAPGRVPAPAPRHLSVVR